MKRAAKTAWCPWPDAKVLHPNEESRLCVQTLPVGADCGSHQLVRRRRLDKAYNQDNLANSGFAVPYAVLGFTGKAWGKVSFNLSINAAASGGAILQQAWIDVAMKEAFAVRIGKFKTPFSHGYLTTLGETMMPTLPTSLTAAVIMPYSLNAVTPNIGTGFDLGVEIHGFAAISSDMK